MTKNAGEKTDRRDLLKEKTAMKFLALDGWLVIGLL